MATKLKGCGRGVFGLKSWEKQPIPEGLAQKLKDLMRSDNDASSLVRSQTSQSQDTSQGTKTTAKKVKEPPSKVPNPGHVIVAKYNYKANPGSPMGAELSLKQGAKLKFIHSSTSNPHWWMAENEEGEQGYVPASYMMILEVTGLPWLQHREPDDDEERVENPVFKPYKPTYDLKGMAGGEDRYACDICNKFFNGPQPYKAHMNSKAHKEEVEIAESYKNM